MSNTDKELGHLVREHLVALGIETPIKEQLPASGEADIAHYTRCTMEALGLNLQDDSLCDTPRRVAKMYCHEVFTGLNYDNFPKCTVIANRMKYDELITVDKIEVKSMCEHHLLPFVGKATVAYIPKEYVMGLSKFNRLVQFFARRPQVQERLTEQIAAALQVILDTDDVAVIIRAEHFCVKLRGIEDTCSDTITSKMLGRFRTVPELRQELLTLVGHNNV